MTLDAFLQCYQQRINSFLQTQLATVDCVSSVLLEATRYSTLSGGKRLRPLLVYATATAVANDELTPYLDNLDHCAAACELLHCYSLVHDDLPAMDNDDWRRGQLTCHKQFDEAQAILVGDGLQALAFHLLTQPMTAVDSQQQLMMLSILSNAVGFGGMVGGQSIDLSNQANTLEQLIKLHQLKTGALFQASVALGAHCVGCHDQTILSQLDNFANYLGLAYQIQDDICDVTQTASKLGKLPCSDERNGKNTFVSLLDLKPAQAYLEKTYQQAHQCLVKLSFSNAILFDLLDHIIHINKKIVT